jgi:hypothetical protein
MHSVQYDKISHHKTLFLSYKPVMLSVSELEIQTLAYQPLTHLMAILVSFLVLLNAR